VYADEGPDLEYARPVVMKEACAALRTILEEVLMLEGEVLLAEARRQ